MYGIASGIGHLGYFTFLLLLAVINVIQFLPISINGLGVREATLVTILAVYGVDEAQAVAFSLLIPLIGLVAAAMGASFTLIDYRPIQSPSKPRAHPCNRYNCHYFPLLILASIIRFHPLAIREANKSGWGGYGKIPNTLSSPRFWMFLGGQAP
jgi:hypothetical protein